MLFFIGNGAFGAIGLSCQSECCFALMYELRIQNWSLSLTLSFMCLVMAVECLSSAGMAQVMAPMYAIGAIQCKLWMPSPPFLVGREIWALLVMFRSSVEVPSIRQTIWVTAESMSLVYPSMALSPCLIGITEVMKRAHDIVQCFSSRYLT